MALFAAILPRCARELALVFIFVAINALRELDLVAGILAGRGMAGGAGYLLVRERKREGGLGVIRGRERRWDPTLDGVAALASAAIGALGF